jgi:hypothetical protein
MAVTMTKDGMPRMLEFLDFLRGKGIQFKLEQQRSEAVMVTFAMVGFRVEVEFFPNHLEFSVFQGDEGVEVDEKLLYDLVNRNWD